MNKDNIFYNEMITQVAFCTHPNPSSVLIVSDYDLKDMTDKHLDVKNCDLISLSDSFDFARDCEDKKYDVIIINSGDKIDDKVFVAHLNRSLKDDGILVFAGQINEVIADFFRICMPYRFEVSKDTKDLFMATFATKKYHPTADMILHKSDLIEGCQYYNSDIHKASFVMPNYIKADIKGFVKN
jgi:spermidine synthase